MSTSSSSFNRVKRTIGQLIVGGSLTGVIVAVAELNPAFSLAVMGAWTVLVAYVQNALEDSGKIKDTRVG